MAIYNYKVNLEPIIVFEMIKKQQNAELVYEEHFNLEDDKFTGTLIFEKYYMRTGSWASLIVIIDNINEYTDIRSISTGSSQGLFSNLDWGAADSFAKSVGNIVNNYIID